MPGGGGFGASSQSNVWFQEAYGAITPSPHFNVRLGKMYQKMGLYWDDSFFGNLLYYSGIMLNPDWGVPPWRDHSMLQGGSVTLNYSGRNTFCRVTASRAATLGRDLPRAPA